MNLRVFYLTRRGISDGYKKRTPNLSANAVLRSIVPRPVHNSVSPQMRLHLAQEATKKRHSLKSLNYHHVTHH